MALPCHLIAQKCHSSKLLQAKPLRAVGEEFPILEVPRTPRVGELSVGDQRLDLDPQVHHPAGRTPTLPAETAGKKQGCPLGLK